MSGGIDSSVAAWSLKHDSHDIVGVTLRFHRSPARDAAVENAIRIAGLLGIEHHVIDLEDEFEEKVMKRTQELLELGLFPNPCSICSSELKIDALFEQADAFGCEKVATGHYAKTAHDSVGFELLPYQLMKPADKAKDQTYLLYTLTQEQLSRLVFPLDDMNKGEVRRLAMRAGLVRLAPVDDGQGEPCFYEKRTPGGWLQEDRGVDIEPAQIVYTPSGAHIGEVACPHDLSPDEPLGEHVVEDGGEPIELFAVFKDLGGNKVYACPRANAGAESCFIRDVHWTSIKPPATKRSCRVRFRYGSKPVPAHILCQDEGVVVSFNERVGGIGAGQAMVFYSDDLVLGGGIISGQ